VPLITKRYNLVPAKKAAMPRGWEGNWRRTGHASQTQWSINKNYMGDQHRAYTPDGARPGLPF